MSDTVYRVLSKILVQKTHGSRYILKLKYVKYANTDLDYTGYFFKYKSE